jgi:hypothetical protein
MATKGKPVLQTKETQLGSGMAAPSPVQEPGKVQVIQGNIPVLTIQILAQINANIIELGKKLDAVIQAAKEG